MDSASDEMPKYMLILRELRSRIVSGDYARGQRLPSESVLVKKFGVSRPTAARAMRELTMEGLVERRAGSGSYVSDRGASVKPAQRQLGLLIPGWDTTEIFETICGQLAGLARTKDFILHWGSARPGHLGQDSDPVHAEQLCRHYIEHRVDGVFFAPMELMPESAEMNQRLTEQLRQAGIPVVLIDRDMEAFPRRSSFDLVGIDNVAAGFLLGQHLLKLGCRRIAFFVEPLSASTVRARVCGVREALLANGVEVPENWVLEGRATDLAAVKRVFSDRGWDACVCANDRMAAQLIRSLLKAGLRVPHDVRVVGFDDVKYATLVAVPLTTVHQPCDEIAALAFDAMLRRLEHPLAPACSFLATPRLVVRESCGTYLPR